MIEWIVPDAHWNCVARFAIELLASRGFCYITDLPIPFPLVDVLSALGPLYPQYDGKVVWDVRSRPGLEGAPTSVGAAAITLHTEFYERPGQPPRYVALFCRTQSQEGGILHLVDGYSILQHTPKHVLTLLRTYSVPFASETSLCEVAHGESSSKEVITIAPDGRTIIQYDSPILRLTDQGLLHTFADAVDDLDNWKVYCVKQEPQSLMIWDNHRLLHGRSGFDSTERWLERVCIAT
jgi:hypothetical protein